MSAKIRHKPTWVRQGNVPEAAICAVSTAFDAFPSYFLVIREKSFYTWRSLPNLSRRDRRQMQQQPCSFPQPLICVAAPQDASLLAHWEIHLSHLEQTGLISVWSPLHLAAGVSRKQELSQQMKHAHLILLLSADFFNSSDCLMLMELALERSRTGIARIIPLILRPVAWQESSLNILAPWPSNEVPVTLLIGGRSSSASSFEIGVGSQRSGNPLARIIGETPTASFQYLRVRARPNRRGQCK